MRGCLISQVTEYYGLDQDFVVHCIRAHWIRPARPDESFLDEEDLARIELIRDLREKLGVNDDGITVTLHLLDQIYALRALIRKSAA